MLTPIDHCLQFHYSLIIFIAFISFILYISSLLLLQVIFITVPSGTSNNFDRLDSRVLDWTTVTNLRFQFVRLQTLGEDIGPTYQDNNEKYYYAVSSLVVYGSCLCYGHASRCIPMPNITPAKLNIAGMVG